MGASRIASLTFMKRVSLSFNPSLSNNAGELCREFDDEEEDLGIEEKEQEVEVAEMRTVVEGKLVGEEDGVVVKSLGLDVETVLVGEGLEVDAEEVN